MNDLLTGEVSKCYTPKINLLDTNETTQYPQDNTAK